MKIVIDMQGAQAQSRNRGIGRYTQSLTEAFLRGNVENDIHLLFNGIFDENDEAIIDRFAPLLATANIHVWHPTGPINRLDPANSLRNAAVTEHYHAYLRSLDPDWLLITSLFEGLGDDAITSVDPRRDYPVAVILYDLIPYILRSPYLDHPAHALWYDDKIQHLRRADLLLAISESSRGEAIEHLNFAPERVINISSAIDTFFKPVNVSPERQQTLRQHYGLTRECILYTGGADHRKNIGGLIRAFALLPHSLRDGHQLAIVCTMNEAEQRHLRAAAQACGLPEDALILTGYIPDHDLLELYNLCKLFVFPSLHEGFGLPALEAMACGAPVIASNTTSLPEVIGREDALFDPRTPETIAAKLREVLENNALREDLARHGPEQAQRFSWDSTARRAIEAINAQGASDTRPAHAAPMPTDRPRLAFVSPLPPARSGISEYSALLLPPLSPFYDIHLIVDQPTVDTSRLDSAWPVHGIQHLLEHRHEYDRIVYQMGNSAFHAHMFDLMEQLPGVVVLHDFFLSGIQAYREYAQDRSHHFASSLYASHGYPALSERMRGEDMAELIWRYPCNLDVLQQARALITHSPEATRLLHTWYGPQGDEALHTIPLVRAPAQMPPHAREQARIALNIAPGAFVVCSFGFASPSKLGDRLLEAWIESGLLHDPEAHLIFVGQADEGEYGQRLMQAIKGHAPRGNIRITGWTDQATYEHYLRAADVGVQLRHRSRGETSAAVLDCMNHGLATLVNAHGSMADLPEGAVTMVPDDFTIHELAQALLALRQAPAMRHELGTRAAGHIHTHHTPEACARHYQAVIEAAYGMACPTAEQIIDRMAALPGMEHVDAASLERLAHAVHNDFPPRIRPRQLLLDISGLHQGLDAPLIKTLLVHLLKEPPRNFRLEPVYLDAQGQSRYARRYTCQQLGIPDALLDDDLIEFGPGDLWLGLEQPVGTIEAQATLYRNLRLSHVHVGLTREKALPGTVEQHIDHLHRLLGGRAQADRTLYVDITELALHDLHTGIQRVVRNILAHWRSAPNQDFDIRCCHTPTPQTGHHLATGWHLRQLGYPQDLLPDLLIEPRAGDIFLGLDLVPHHIPEQAERLAQWRARGVHTAFVVYDLLCLDHPEFFDEGADKIFARWLDTVNQADQLIAISNHVAQQLRRRLGEHAPRIDVIPMGADMDAAPPDPDPLANARLTTWLPQDGPNLLMVGTLEPRKGHADVLQAVEHLWSQGIPVNLIIVGRRGWRVDDLAQRIEDHPQNEQRLFWLQNADDPTLNALYRRATLLISASHGEGFGLPLIEAARANLPILARDIPIFREVMGEHATYFSADTPEALARAIQASLTRKTQGTLPSSAHVKIATWGETAHQLMERIRSGARTAPG